MIRGLMLFTVGFIVANRLEARLAAKNAHTQERDEAWTGGEDDKASIDSFPASDAPASNPTSASPSGVGPH